MKEERTKVVFKEQNLVDATDILNKIKNKDKITEINLSDNNLTFLPPDLSAFANLQILNILNNDFKDYNQLVKSLLTLPQLTDLYLDLEKESDAVIILESLPQLEFLNGRCTKSNREGEEEEEEEEEEEKAENYNEENQIKEGEIMLITDDYKEHNEDIELDLNNEGSKENSLEEESENFNSIIRKVVSYYGNEKDKTDKFYSEFKEKLQKQINHINTLIDPPVAKYLYTINLNQSKLEMYAYLKNKIISILTKDKPNANTNILISALGEIENYTKQASNGIFSTITSIGQDIDKKNEEINISNKKKLSEIEEQNDQITKLKEEINKKDNLLNERTRAIKYLEKENSNLQSKNTKMKEQSDEITQKLLEKAKAIIRNEKRNDDEIYPVNINGNNLSIKNVVNQNDLNKPIGQIKTRVISKKNLIDVINDIYKTKEQCDKKNKMNKMPKETLEQHMYNYLNHKFGLKNLIIEWATCIINGIKMYYKEDGDIRLFGKILRNELEESSVKVVTKIKSTLDKLIKFFFSEKYPNKSAAYIKDILSKIKGNMIYLDDFLWISITQAIFNKNQKECSHFMKKIHNFIKVKITGDEEMENLNVFTTDSGKFVRKEERDVISQAKCEEKILYKDYLQLLLRNQIKRRTEYLSKFVNLFREIDVDLNGVINNEQFHLLLKNCNIYNNENDLSDNFDRLIEIVDPFGNNIITFSDVVDLLEKEVIDGQIAMDKIALSEVA